MTYVIEVRAPSPIFVNLFTVYINFHSLKGSKCAAITIYTVIEVWLMLGHRHKNSLRLRLIYRGFSFALAIFTANLHAVCQSARDAKLWRYRGENVSRCVCHELYSDFHKS